MYHFAMESIYERVCLSWIRHRGVRLYRGCALSVAMAIILMVAAFGSGLAGILGAARLLFGMGQDGVLPRKIFGRLDKRTATPRLNIILLGVVGFVGAVIFGLIGDAYQYSGEIINFGAFLAFMGGKSLSLLAIRC